MNKQYRVEVRQVVEVTIDIDPDLANSVALGAADAVAAALPLLRIPTRENVYCVSSLTPQPPSARTIDEAFWLVEPSSEAQS